ncbi:phosphoglycerate mutase [Lamprobacter modestohalophilus]|uniref:Phosphoglycerate mutase n=1 Tax=Lamprobacter modestohalophilus TaxID=1064514 RepID=A0A9X1B4Q0_9GAMM|nr:2,3-bisphosphoglycerate-independent phosphoglycerate mutase [Lamprobacter modestohalophilus]MBK1619274.1 phosphoglycerate mutase [Lamprobacter modestohalophilus]
MDITDTWQELIIPGGKIVYLVMDGLGGLGSEETGRTALDTAETPNLDALAHDSSCGLLEMVGPGITPGSGPGHLALFGYDPLRWRIGRGVLSALGIDFPLQPGDLAARVNFASINSAGEITDRRAGRIPTELNQRLCAKIQDALDLDFDGEVFLKTESQHRAVLVLRSSPDGDALYDDLPDTDPQATGRPSIPMRPQSDQAKTAAEVVAQFLEQAHAAIADEQPANALLLRGFQRHQVIPGLQERFGLNGLCIAEYPMYRGLSRLLGMDIAEPPTGMDALFESFEQQIGDEHDFYFLHVKGTDSAGEDGNVTEKVAVIEEVDRRIPWLLEQRPDVLVVTGDHSTPAVMSAHSWHPVPVLLHARNARRDAAQRFDETSCLKGALGLRPGCHLLGLALGHAGRMKKFGA